MKPTRSFLTIPPPLRNTRAVLVAVVVAITVSLAAWAYAHADAHPTPHTPSHTNGRYTFADLADRVLPSVVTVEIKRSVTQKIGGGFGPHDLFRRHFRQFENDPRFRQFEQFFDRMEPQERERVLEIPSVGSGVILSSDGYIVTNHHVVGEADADGVELTLVLYDGTEIPNDRIEIVESNALADLALLKVETDEDLTPIAWGDSDALRLGERVAAVGTPFRLQGTVTQGIVGAKHRQIGGGLGDMIQTDAVINPGSSGGALVNLDGELVGINRLIATHTGAWLGYGFAIPSADVHAFVDKVRATGRFVNGYIGISMAGPAQDTKKMREALGVDPNRDGVLVVEVTRDAPAARAGLRAGDFIIRADDTPIESPADLVGYVARQPVGGTIELALLRADDDDEPEQLEIDVEIAERPDERELMDRLHGRQPKPQIEPETEGILGLDVEPFEDGDVRGLRIVTIAPESPAMRANLKPGDILLQLNRHGLAEREDLERAVDDHKGDRPHVVQFIRNGRVLLGTIDAE